MNYVTYVRTLTYSEAKRNFIRVDAEHRKMFPPIMQHFTLIGNYKRYQTKIDRQSRIWLTKSYEFKLKQGAKFEIIKNANDTYSIRQLE